MKSGINFFMTLLIFILLSSSKIFSGTNYVDGEYFACYDFVDGHGWRPELKIVIKNNKIIDAIFDYKDSEGNLKTNNEKYGVLMKKKSNIGPVEFVKEFKQRILKKQSAGIDAVTGATHSTQNFNALSEAILSKALKGDFSKTVLPMDSDYSFENNEEDKEGFTAKISISFKDGKIANVVYDELNKNSVSKKNDAAYNKTFLKKNKISSKELIDKLEKSLIEAQDVDKIAEIKGKGANEISQRFKKCAKLALSQRKTVK
ncbi:MAG TPA: FMN-binding protein [Spirochaetota bacterium]|nr:MAG: FMN-binding domain protein [Spirochaetes bacterium ADurb.Bin133]HNZ28131.1 FMN-binding protein [Spirochaetota bacterium]HPY88836.1 FMN-binding protein [Spirochaetota bacterium]